MKARIKFTGIDQQLDDSTIDPGMRANLNFTLYTSDQTFEGCYVPIKGVVGGKTQAGEIEVYPAVGVPDPYKNLGEVARKYYQKGIQAVGAMFGLRPGVMSNNFIGFTWETDIDI